MKVAIESVEKTFATLDISMSADFQAQIHLKNLL